MKTIQPNYFYQQDVGIKPGQNGILSDRDNADKRKGGEDNSTIVSNANLAYLPLDTSVPEFFRR